jgi:crotonobetainyl-CoA:carnitine CoA-transferase CaiB-like acyl-CoA transferase
MIIKSDGDIPHLGSPMRFHGIRARKTTSHLQLGQHTREVLAEAGLMHFENRKLRR